MSETKKQGRLQKCAVSLGLVCGQVVPTNDGNLSSVVTAAKEIVCGIFLFPQTIFHAFSSLTQVLTSAELVQHLGTVFDVLSERKDPSRLL